MDKVKLTKEQARMIENHRGSFESLMRKHHTKNCPTYIDELTTQQVVDAYFGGYEVEETFKVGDWITSVSGVTCQITKIRGDEVWGQWNRLTVTESYIKKVNVRHATPEEVAEEKQRRWWAKHNRDVFEFKTGDLIDHDHYVVEVMEVRNDMLRVEINTTVATITEEYYDLIKVICFAEDRKDI